MALLTVYLGGDLDALAVATAACGLGFEREGEAGRVVGSHTQLLGLADELAERGLALETALRGALEPIRSWVLRTRTLELDRPRVMGIVNLTTDSFSGDGVGADTGAALRRAEELRAAGADIIDVGAETARADRPVMEEGEESLLLGAAVSALTREGHIVSADTYKPAVARAAVDSGAEIVNDISGLTAGNGAALAAARAGAGYVLNYSYSVPKKRPGRPPEYQDVVAETLMWAFERLEALAGAGVARERIVLDPGIAFGKSHDEDVQVLRRIGEFTSTGQPLLLAHSRKNFIGSVTGLGPADRDLETHVASALAYAQGVRVFRVHDVAGTRRALEMAAAILDAEPGAFAAGRGSWPWREGASADHMTREAPDKPAPEGQRW